MTLQLNRVLVGLTAIGGLALLPGAVAQGSPEAASVNAEFKMMDTNSDGRLSMDEHATGAKKMFETMDANGDGRVTAAEMEAVHETVTGEKAKKTEMSAAEKIKMIDADHDGVLTGEEHEDGAKMVFEKMDTNKDGVLRKSELAAGHAKMIRTEPRR